VCLWVEGCGGRIDEGLAALCSPVPARKQGGIQGCAVCALADLLADWPAVCPGRACLACRPYHRGW